MKQTKCLQDVKQILEFTKENPDIAPKGEQILEIAFKINTLSSKENGFLGRERKEFEIAFKYYEEYIQIILRDLVVGNYEITKETPVYKLIQRLQNLIVNEKIQEVEKQYLSELISTSINIYKAKKENPSFAFTDIDKVRKIAYLAELSRKYNQEYIALADEVFNIIFYEYYKEESKRCLAKLEGYSKLNKDIIYNQPTITELIYLTMFLNSYVYSSIKEKGIECIEKENIKQSIEVYNELMDIKLKYILESNIKINEDSNIYKYIKALRHSSFADTSATLLEAKLNSEYLKYCRENEVSKTRYILELEYREDIIAQYFERFIEAESEVCLSKKAAKERLSNLNRLLKESSPSTNLEQEVYLEILEEN
ncbi:MAG: hypothetical protein RSB87_04400 [Clostridia bacterium]